MRRLLALLLLLLLAPGAAFGAIVHWLWDWSVGKTTAVLVLVWFLQTFAQQLLRMFDGVGSIDETLIVGSYRLTFAIAALIVVGVLHRRCD